MYFKKLELVGFKSFYHKTTLNFEPGITAVVGPNGCGKSNIFDSIRWVLGEQSAKELRGSDMQDVIFNGTDTKESLGMAEVTVTFDNTQKFFSLEAQEVAITRRLFRSGESEYLLNKSPVRLKDILELLMGTGIGAESYSLIQQGRIDLVLSSRPEDRRLVFDEASGITKYKAQKRETMRKLEETQSNLLRVNDIVTEVKRQIGSLERQATKARRYKEVFEELKSKEIALGAFQKNSILVQKQELEGLLTGLHSQESALQAAIQEQESRIANRQSEIRLLEEKTTGIKTMIMELESASFRNSERMRFNLEKIRELEQTSGYLAQQIEQTTARLAQDEEKLRAVQKEFDSIKSVTDEKQQLLGERERQLNEVTTAIHVSLGLIATAKKSILDNAVATAAVKNEIADIGAKQQILQARQKRLELEKAKTVEEKAQIQDQLTAISQEVLGLQEGFGQFQAKISQVQAERASQQALLNEINAQLTELERTRISLQSHKEFLETLKVKYDDITESVNAVVDVDKPVIGASGLVIKIKGQEGTKIYGEAKPIDLSAQDITQKIADVASSIEDKIFSRAQKETAIKLLDQAIVDQNDSLRSQEMALVNKKANRQAIQDQFNKLCQEEEVIDLELSDLLSETAQLGGKAAFFSARLQELQLQASQTEELVHREQASVDAKAMAKEEVVAVVAQIRAELESLQKRIASDSATLAIVQGTFDRDKGSLDTYNQQALDANNRSQALQLEIQELECATDQAKNAIHEQHALLAVTQAQYNVVSNTSVDVVKKIDADRKKLDATKKAVYDIQMQQKDIDFKYQSIRERLQQAYKVDLDTPDPAPPVVQDAQEILHQEPAAFDEQTTAQEIERLKDKIDSYGTVNLVAIEEYDELKKRYEFLAQQHADLTAAQESLHEAILKINRTTRKMFLDTFELVRTEFRTYFRLLFGGGDAQVYLTDENDPLESGIEIICRPPGKKLQNVLLLSGGEKSMSAIALIFAIFKVKPAPFCVLDEIDAALDEANVDRYSRTLHEFAKDSQFIVITHNKKTIANADIMYGITMEESGVSKIVSVKFAKEKSAQDTAQEPVGASA